MWCIVIQLVRSIPHRLIAHCLPSKGNETLLMHASMVSSAGPRRAERHCCCLMGTRLWCSLSMGGAVVVASSSIRTGLWVPGFCYLFSVELKNNADGSSNEVRGSRTQNTWWHFGGIKFYVELVPRYVGIGFYPFGRGGACRGQSCHQTPKRYVLFNTQALAKLIFLTKHFHVLNWNLLRLLLCT